MTMQLEHEVLHRNRTRKQRIEMESVFSMIEIHLGNEFDVVVGFKMINYVTMGFLFYDI
jgi:hypothetical protein